MKLVEKSVKIAGKELTLATGHVAEQAGGAVMATFGETVVLATVVASPPKEDLGYFPLSVEYEEKLYSAGRIKGSRWVKRKGKPSDEEVLVARLVDRSIRPLFPKEYNKDVQVVLTVLSSDLQHIPDMVAATAASAAIAVSPIPWMGPIGTVRVATQDGKFVTNPLLGELENSDLDLVVSATKDAIVMIEMGGNQVPEAKILDAVEYSQGEIKKLIDFIEKFAKEAGKKKEKVEKKKVDVSLESKVKKLTKGNLLDLAKKMATKEVGYDAYDEIKKAVVDEFEDEDKKEAAEVFEDLFSSEIRRLILSGKRLDGRKMDQLRELSSEVAVLPRTHGTGLFRRGQTQALSIATLGSSSLEQIIESAGGEFHKRYIHHYEMPPYSTGETGRMGYPKRREIGHGALAEKALLPLIPSSEKFPYTIRIVTQILSSNGSTSMASVCGSSLSLMDAGVPIKAPVAGIAMGVVVDTKTKYKVLTDIVGIEDGNGDMDFKVAGTSDGVTALQLDVKTLKLSLNILKDAFEDAKKAREKILSVMTSAISKPREKVSKYAPKIVVVNIPIDKIGELIGPGGKTVKGITLETGAEVDIEDDGSVTIAAVDQDAVSQAVEKVKALTKEVKPGEIYEGVVKRLQSFGAFVEILPGKEGLVHVSDISNDFVKDPADVLKLEQKVKVRVKEIDDFKRINLSMLLDGDKPSFAKKGKGNSNHGNRKERKGRGQYDRSRGRRSDRNSQRGRRTKGKGGGGPHFPTSRLMNLDKKDFNR